MHGGRSVSLCHVHGGLIITKKAFLLARDWLAGQQKFSWYEGQDDAARVSELGRRYHEAQSNSGGEGVSVTPPLSPHFLVLKRKTPLLHPFMHLALYFSPWKKSSRAEALFSPAPNSWSGDILPFQLCCDQPCAQSRRAEVAVHMLPFWHSCQMCQGSTLHFTVHFATSALVHPNFFPKCTQRQARPLKTDYSGEKNNYLNVHLSCASLLSPPFSHGNKSIYNFPYSGTLHAHGKHLLGDPRMTGCWENIKHPTLSQTVKSPHQKALVVLRKGTYLEWLERSWPGCNGPVVLLRQGSERGRGSAPRGQCCKPRYTLRLGTCFNYCFISFTAQEHVTSWNVRCACKHLLSFGLVQCCVSFTWMVPGMRE